MSVHEATAEGTDADSASLQRTRCPICETNGSDREVYAMNFQPQDLNGAVFSARRLPDRLHYRMVRCRRCGLLRSDPILPAGELARLYESSQFTYETEAEFARAQLFAQHGLWYDTIAAYSDLIERNPDRPELYQQRAAIYSLLDATKDQAERDLSRARELGGAEH